MQPVGQIASLLYDILFSCGHRIQHIIFNVHKVPARYLLMNSKRLKTVFFNPQLRDTVVMLLVLLLQYHWQEATKRIWQFRSIWTSLNIDVRVTMSLITPSQQGVTHGHPRTTRLSRTGQTLGGVRVLNVHKSVRVHLKIDKVPCLRVVSVLSPLTVWDP